MPNPGEHSRAAALNDQQRLLPTGVDAGVARIQQRGKFFGYPVLKAEMGCWLKLLDLLQFIARSSLRA
jgi:hypothetical protein